MEREDRQPWRDIARQNANVREWKETAKSFTGDPRTAAALLPLARTLLGGLEHQMALGGVSQGCWKKQLPDGSIIIVAMNSGIRQVRIETPVTGSSTSTSVFQGFVIYPRSNVAPKGWSLDTKGNRILRQGDSLILLPSCFEDGGIFVNFMPLGYDNNGYNGFYFPEGYYDKFYSGSLIYDVIKDTTATLRINQKIHHGNQYYFSGRTVYSWWHSSFGDLPVNTHATTAWNPGYFYGIDKKLLSSYNYNKLVGHLYYTDSKGKSSYMLPGIMKNGIPLVDFSVRFERSEPYSGYSNGFVSILNAARYCVAGFFPITETEFLVVLVKDWTSFEIYQVKLTNKFFVPEMTLLYGGEGIVVSPGAMTAPFRFNQDGTQCATVFGRPYLVGSVSYSQPTLLVINLAQELDEANKVKYQYQSNTLTEYTLFEDTGDTGYESTTNSEDSGWVTVDYWIPMGFRPGEYHVYEERETSTTASATRESQKKYRGDTRFPVSVDFKGNELVKIELDFGATEDYATYSHQSSGRRVRIKIDKARGSDGRIIPVVGGIGSSNGADYIQGSTNATTYAMSSDISTKLIVNEKEYNLGADTTLLSVLNLDSSNTTTGYAYFVTDVQVNWYQRNQSYDKRKTAIYVNVATDIVIIAEAGPGLLSKTAYYNKNNDSVDSRQFLNLQANKKIEFHNIEAEVKRYGETVAFNYSGAQGPTPDALFFHAGTKPTPYEQTKPVWPSIPYYGGSVAHNVAVDHRELVTKNITDRALGLFAFRVYDMTAFFNGSPIKITGFEDWFTTLKGLDEKLAAAPVTIEYINPFGVF